MSQSTAQGTGKSLWNMSRHEKKEESPAEYPSMQKRILVMIALYLSIFLVTLVQSNLFLPASRDSRIEFANYCKRTKTLSRQQSLESQTSFTL
jgi:hypothetical protein